MEAQALPTVFAAHSLCLTAAFELSLACDKAIVRACLDEGGARGADARVPALAGALFDTADLQGAVRSFLEQGPGHAVHEGR